MRNAMWTYPWDIQDIGLEQVLRDLRERAGVDSMSVASSYHAGRFLQARSPVRKSFYPEDGTIYFQPDRGLWRDGVIRPKVADVIDKGGDVLHELVRERDRGGLGVSCWTVCLHNTRLGMLHPHAVTRNAFGDPNYYNLCPSNPDARAYVRTLVADLTRRYKPDRVELESLCFMGFAHEYHHEKDMVGLTREDDFLLSLCFCRSCVASASGAGVDIESVREQVRGWITDACERAVPEARFPRFPEDALRTFEPWPELHAFLRWRTEPVTSLVGEIREAADPASRIVVIDLADGWLGGCDLKALGKVCDGALLCAYDTAAEDVAALLSAGREALGPEGFLGAGFRLYYPEIGGPEALRERVDAARDAGCDGLNFYNYGLVPAARLDWIGSAVRAVAGG